MPIKAMAVFEWWVGIYYPDHIRGYASIGDAIYFAKRTPFYDPQEKPAYDRQCVNRLIYLADV